MRISVSLDEKEIRIAIAQYIANKTGGAFQPKFDYLPIETKSKQNYRSVWEQADIRVNTEYTQ